jgi:dihydrofolate reductase
MTLIKKTFSIITAISKNYCIGKNNNLLWHIPDDLKRFKKTTLEHTVIMGRKTYEALPKKPLKDRRNIIITRDKHYSKTHKDIIIVHSIDEAINYSDKQKENFIIGGSQIYKEFMNKVNKIYLTLVHKEYEGDAFFPKINLYEWKVTKKEKTTYKNIPITYFTLEKT